MRIVTILEELFDENFVGGELFSLKLLNTDPIRKEINYLSAPWANIINFNRLKDVPKIKLDGGFTICDHVEYEKIIPILKRIGISVLFAPHVIKQNHNSFRLTFGSGRLKNLITKTPLAGLLVALASCKLGQIIVLPYPILCQNGVSPAEHKDILYSFIGYDSTSLINSNLRKIILSMQHPTNTVIKERPHWHWAKKMNWGNLSEEQQKLEMFEYKDVLARSRFSLCPRGFGPATIRFWESLEAGAIPIVLADDFSLPDGFLWDKCIVRIPEREVLDISSNISKIPLKEEEKMRYNCLAAHAAFSAKNFTSTIRLYYGK